MPERSFFYKGEQFPVCARCTGAALGQFLFIIFAIFSMGKTRGKKGSGLSLGKTRGKKAPGLSLGITGGRNAPGLSLGKIRGKNAPAFTDGRSNGGHSLGIPELKNQRYFFLLLPLGIDWLVQFWQIRESNNRRRFVTGILGGFAVFGLYRNFFYFISRWIKNKRN